LVFGCSASGRTMSPQKITTLIRQFNQRRLRGSILNILGALLFFAGFSGGALASEAVPFEELGGDQCFMFSLLVPTRMEGENTIELPFELVINNEEDYKKLFDPQIMRQSCADVDPSKRIPDVDFSKKTVLGLWSSGSCGDTRFEKSVSKDDIKKSILYSVTVIGSDISFCSGPGLESLNLIAIPKIPPGHKVFFENFRKEQ
jgi:hypothetical protein